MPKTRYLCKSFRSNTLDIIELAQCQLEPLGSVDLEQAHRDDLKDAVGRWRDVVAHLKGD